MLEANGVHAVHADFTVYPKSVPIVIPPNLSLNRSSFPAAPSGGITGPPDFSSDYGTIVTFIESDHSCGNSCRVILVVSDSYGRQVAAIDDRDAHPGQNQLYWSGRTDNPDFPGALSPGPYVMTEVETDTAFRYVGQVAFTIVPFHLGHT